MAALCLFLNDPDGFPNPQWELGKENLFEQLKNYFHLDTFDATKILLLYILWNFISIQLHNVYKYFGSARTKSKRLSESVWRCCYQSGVWGYALHHTLAADDNTFQKPYAAWEAWGDIDALSECLRLFFLLQLSFHIYTITHLLREGKKEKHALSIACLHALLLVLTGLFYTLHYYQVGLLVCLFYDAAGLTVEITRINAYLEKASSIFKYLSYFSFVIYSCVWTYLTLYLFPMKVLYLSVISTLTKVDRPLLEMITFVLILLQLYNLYWLLVVLHWLKKLIFKRRDQSNSSAVYYFFHQKAISPNGHRSPSSVNSSSDLKNDAKALIQTVKCVIRLKRKLKKIREEKQQQCQNQQVFEVQLSPMESLTIDVSSKVDDEAITSTKLQTDTIETATSFDSKVKEESSSNESKSDEENKDDARPTDSPQCYKNIAKSTDLESIGLIQPVLNSNVEEVRKIPHEIELVSGELSSESVMSAYFPMEDLD